MNGNPFQDYLTSQVFTSDPVSLIGLLYDGLLLRVEEARAALRNGDIRARSEAITRSIEILGELAASLDCEGGPELEANLRRLYEYMIRRLIEANGSQLESPLAEVAGLAGTLAEAWRTLAGHRALSAPPQSVYAAPQEQWSCVG